MHFFNSLSRTNIAPKETFFHRPINLETWILKIATNVDFLEDLFNGPTDLETRIFKYFFFFKSEGPSEPLT